MSREKILQLIQLKGPVVPSQLVKDLGQDTIMTSAMLSELVSSHHLKLSSLKYGSSPLYFIPGQEAKLQQFSEKLNDKQKIAYDLLKQKIILRDKLQQPVIRVALREIKDFAVPLSVTINNNREIYWRWFLISDEQASELIKKDIGLVAPVQEEPKPMKPAMKPQLKQPPVKKPTVQRPLVQPQDSFFGNIEAYLKSREIIILEKEIIRKNSEVDLIVEIVSKVGPLKYYCKCRNKKRVSDADLSSAYVKGHFKKLPVLFVTPGVLTKKAQEMLAHEFSSITMARMPEVSDGHKDN